jgi:hypothetical protein
MEDFQTLQKINFLHLFFDFRFSPFGIRGFLNLNPDPLTQLNFTDPVQTRIYSTTLASTLSFSN